MKTITYLGLAAGVALLFSIATAQGAETVSVKETCSKYDCVISITGEDSPCIRSAREKNWESGYMAAVSIRNCMDKASEKVAAR